MVIDTFLEEALGWQATGEFTVPKRADLQDGLSDEDKAAITEEVNLMIASIRKRYKLDARLPQQAAQIQPEEDKMENPTDEAKEMMPELVKEDKEAGNTKGTRKASAGEKKTPERKPRANKKSETEA